MVKSAENKQAEMSGTPVSAQIKKAASGSLYGRYFWE